MEIFDIPEDIGALDAADLQAFIDATVARLGEVAADPASFVNENRDSAQLRAEMASAVDAVKEARVALAAFVAAEEPTAEAEQVEAEEAEEPAEEAALEDADELAAEAAAALAAAEEQVEVEEVEEPAAVVAAAAPARRRSPARSRAAAPQETTAAVSLVAAGGGDTPQGTEFPDLVAVAGEMIKRQHGITGIHPEGTYEKIPVAGARWSHLYPRDRVLGRDEEANASLIAAATDPKAIKAEFERRRKLGDTPEALVASGGLCAPVTPYYNLLMISVAERPVRSALAGFNADRGGIRAALPASLAAITTGVGAMTVAQDQAGGTTGTKTCQTVDCPSFVETDVEILYHCLRFGNLGARTFPERVAQWNSLVLAAHARLAERTLLTGIDAASTAVTAASLGLGAAADLLSEALVAAAGMRSRHRMDPDAVLRAFFPRWVLDLLVSDVYRSQFERFDMTPEKFVALLRQGGIEPTFTIDSASGKGQEFGTQNAGALLPFPSTVTWYLHPEGSFLYLDGGTLELGIVRDSVLNSTNDFEIFGESFENVAYIGVEALAITSTVCDNGITAGTHNVLCPIDYSHTS